jgi:hypothetical protein
MGSKIQHESLSRINQVHSSSTHFETQAPYFFTKYTVSNNSQERETQKTIKTPKNPKSNMQDSTKLPPMQPNQEMPTTPPTQINTNSKPNKKQNTNPRPPKFLRYLFKLTPALGQQNNLIVECLPGSRFEAELKNVGDGLFGAGHLASQPHLLLHIQQLLYRRL